MDGAVPGGPAATRAARCATRAGAVRRPPEQLWRSLAWGHGEEMSGHVRFTVDTRVQAYFCDPRSPWQRGANEHTNGLLRQYLPEAADLRAYTQQPDLDAIAAELSGRPRETPGRQSPAARRLELAGAG